MTAENWQLAPYNRWAFWHVSEVLPTRQIARGAGPVRVLPKSNGDGPELSSIAVTRADGSVSTAEKILADTFTDAYLILQDGATVAEWYGHEGGPGRPHALMSVSKSMVGCVAAALGDRGLLDIERPVTDHVPQLAGSGYVGATIRHLLDMRSGVRFREDYLDQDAEVQQLAKAIGWSTGETGGVRGIYPYLTTLSAEVLHGTRFLYRSAETDVLGWVCEQAAGKPMSELISTLIWQPMGAEFDAQIMSDVTGTAVHDGGICAAVRDVGRFGQLLLDNGSVPHGQSGSRAVIGSRWFRHAWAVDAEARRLFDASPAEASMPGGWYRNQFWLMPGAHGTVLLCLGIYGQLVYVSRRTRTVFVKVSSWPQPQVPEYLHDTLRMCDAVSGALAGRQAADGTHHLPGVIAGLSRHGRTPRSGL